jgi:serralysin
MAAKTIDDKNDHPNAYIDALVGDGWHWSGTVTYFFDNDVAIWTAAEKAAYRSALQSWANVANITFQEVFIESDANFVEHSVSDSALDGALADHATPMMAKKTHVVEGNFNYERYSVLHPNQKPGYDEAGLVKGGFGYETFVHELGHALGLQHPHTREDGSGLFPGVREGVQTDLGDNGLNQVIYTVMSYNEFDQVKGSSSYGYVAGPMAYDIAAIQYLYGAKAANTGSDTYWLPDTNGTGTYWSCIWDTGGTDTIVYGGNGMATIDLRAATLDNSATGGGMISRVTDATTGKGIHGGYTIANGVVIENASGGSNDDVLRGNSAANFLKGNNGNDVLEGFDGNDVLDQGLGGGAMYGGNGNDTLIAGDGADILDGGSGSDTVDYSRSSSGIIIDTTIGKIDGGWAVGDTLISIENIVGTGFDDHIVMGAGGNTIDGGAGNDTLNGGLDADTLMGGAGDDWLHGGLGADSIGGGSGFDVATFQSAVLINLQTGARGGEAIGDTYVSIEQFNGSAESDTMVASNLQGARFAGGDGVDYLYGGDQGDWLQGGKGADYINGGAGSDTVSYADASYGITAEMYFDGDTTLGHTEGKITAGEWGVDTLVSIENVEGSQFGDYLIGDERANTFWGLGGDDTIVGDREGGPQGSADTMYGGAGNDSILIGASDTAYGGTGSDTAMFVGGPIFISYASNTFMVGGQPVWIAEFETYIGSNGNDTVFGDAYGETISLGNGNDYLYGQGGDDFLHTGAGIDVMDGGAGYDTMVFHKAMVADWQSGVVDADIGWDSWSGWEAIQGSGGDDVIRTNSWGFSVELRGGAGNDVLATGVTGVVSDILNGEAGDDTLDGGAGDDALTGGTGADWFVVGAGGGIDSITDFIAEEGDRIDFSGIAGVHSLADLTVTQHGLIAIVTAASGEGVLLWNVAGDTLTDDLFLFAPDPGNQAPVDIELSNWTIEENAAADTVVGTLAAVDPDLDETFTYELVDDAGGLFAIVGDTLVVAGALDFETAAAHVVTVRATDSVGNIVDKTFAIDVADANDAPTAAPDTGAAGENDIMSFDVLANDTDPDLGDIGALVSIDAAVVSSGNPFVDGTDAVGAFWIENGQIQFDPGALFDPLDAGETATVEVTYTMSDALGLISSSTLTVTIDGAAEPDAGDDTIVSSLGSEVMAGGAGADTFVFQAVQSQAGDVDTITDFVVGEDRLQFDGLSVVEQSEIDIDGDLVLDTALTLDDGATVQLLGVNNVNPWEVLA